MYQVGKRYWDAGTIVKRIGRMTYLVKGPKMVHKRHLNQTKSRHTHEENDTPVDVEPMEVLFDTFDVPIPQKAPETKMQQRQIGKEPIQSTLTQIGKDLTLCRVNLKRTVLYNLLVNSNGYVPFLINTLDTIMRAGNLLMKNSPQVVVYFLHGVGKYYI